MTPKKGERSHHRDAPRADDSLVEVRVPFVGGAIPLDHGYLLYSAIKQEVSEELTKKGWHVGRVKEGSRQDDLLRFHTDDDRPCLRFRVPIEDVDLIRRLDSRNLRLGNHIITCGEAILRDIQPAHTLHSPFVVICNENRAPQGHYEADLGLAVGKRLGAWLGRADIGLTMGTRRTVQIAGATYHGNPVSIAGVDEEESVYLQRVGIGARRTMGCGVIWPKEGGMTE